MVQPRDGRQPAPNIQDVFLNHVRRERFSVIVHLMNGEQFEGRIKNFDRYAVIIEHNGVDQMVFKHAIATIGSPKPIGNYYASHES